jgi:hypothetical protein
MGIIHYKSQYVKVLVGTARLQNMTWISSQNLFFLTNMCVKWVPVTTAWHVLGLGMEERPPVMEGSCEYIE